MDVKIFRRIFCNKYVQVSLYKLQCKKGNLVSPINEHSDKKPGETLTGFALERNDK